MRIDAWLRASGRLHRLAVALAALALTLAACSGPTQTGGNVNTTAPTATATSAATATSIPPTATATSIPIATATTRPPTATKPPTKAPTKVPTATSAPEPTKSAAVTAPTATTAPTGSGLTTIIVPATTPTPEAQAVPIEVAKDYTSELQTFFTTFYKARTLAPGGQFDIATTRGLTAPPYQEYTIDLLQQDIADAQAGKLLAVTYTDIGVKLVQWDQGTNGGGTAVAELTRTMHTTSAGNQKNDQTATYQYRLRRQPIAGDAKHVTWVAYDFYNPGASAWVSDLINQPTASSILPELNAFFQEFYGLRSVKSGGQFDIDANAALTAFAYHDYTIPILQRDQGELQAGKLTSISYSDIKVELVSWDPAATNHGGIATVRVTRTSNVVRPAGAEAPDTSSYQFRVHRHTDEQGKARWIAVDFFNPTANAWVSASAGQPWIVPESGHG
ncbi:MAG: hypothetical protein ACTHNK_02800 [Thermomicrobiales bacterium]